MKIVEFLADRADRAGGALVRRGAYRLGGGGVHGVELAAVHALEQQEVPAGIDHGHGDGRAGLLRGLDRGILDVSRAFCREALGVGDIHELYISAWLSPTSNTSWSRPTTSTRPATGTRASSA